MTETTTETKELALFPKLNLPTVTGITEQMNKSFGTMYTRIEAGIAALPTDMSIKKNREEVASYAYSISRTKTGLDEAAAGVSGDAKLIVDAVNKERRELKETLDGLRDKARAALDAWEATEKERQERISWALDTLKQVKASANGKTSDAIAEIRDRLQEWEITAEIYGDRLEEITAEHMTTIDFLEDGIDEAEKREAEAAELEQLRREKAEREAAEEAKRLEAERIEKERIAEQRRQEEEAQRVENERIEKERIAEEARQQAAREAQEKIDAAEKAAADAEAQRIHEAEQARKREIEAEEARQREAEEAEARRIREADEAAERQRQAEERARQEERDRIEQERAEEERQRLAKEKADQERAADLAHRKKVNSAAVEAIMKAAGVAEKDAQAIVVAIYKEQVPNVSISY